MRIRASAMLRAPKCWDVLIAVIMLYEWLCCELLFLQLDLGWLALGLTYSDKYSTPWPNSFGCSLATGGSNSLISSLWWEH